MLRMVEVPLCRQGCYSLMIGLLGLTLLTGAPSLKRVWIDENQGRELTSDESVF